MAFTACFLASAVVASAQAHKPGLYESTTTMTFQQSPFPQGMGPAGHGPQTAQVCVTQEEVDKFGTVPPQKREGCSMTNMVKHGDGFTADMVCTGKMSAKGTVVTTFADGKGKMTMHMLGTVQAGPTPKPIEWSVETISTYKGPDCGSVKPIEQK